MPELRWILLTCGAILLIAIYAWGRRSARQGAASEDATLRMHPESSMSVPPESAADRFSMQDDALEPPPQISAAPVYARPADFTITAVRSTREEEADIPVRTDTAYRPAGRDTRRGRIEPTLDDNDVPTEDVFVTTAELPVEETSRTAPESPAPTLSMSSTPAPKRIERRKIVALRLAAGSQRFAGAQLRQVLEEEELAYGKYDVFHRLHTDGAHIFSVASMVEPGTFEREKMGTLAYPGVTLFAQLPGPVAGVEAMNQLVACGKRLQEQLGGTLQDERGVPLTVHRMERLRQEVREFESAQGMGHGRELPDAGLH
jgi:cell division protein ZipA